MDIPIVLFVEFILTSTLSQSYMFGVFPNSRPTHQVGYIMAAFGAADVVGR